jgi:predicted DNA-binding transcriptional regulator AlpA
MTKDPPINSPGNQHSESPPSDGPTPDPEDLWTTKQVGKFLHISAKSVFELRKKGLPFVKLGGAVRFVPREIREYLANSRRLTSHRLRQIARKGSPA